MPWCCASRMKKPDAGARSDLQPLLPLSLRPGRAAQSAITKRHGTTALFAALDIAIPGRVLGRCYRRHRATEFRKPAFLLRCHRRCCAEADLDIHLVMDNYATHKAPAIKACRLPNGLAITFTSLLHLRPPGLNQVERWFCASDRARARSAAVFTAASRNWRRSSPPSSLTTMPLRGHFSGPNPQIKSSAQSPDSAKEHSLSTQILKRIFGSEH